MAQQELSIIIITLNEQHTLPRLLGDLKSQSWKDFEIIHVDSRSKDETVSVSRAASGEFKHFHIIEMKHRGVSLGRNVGAAAARGKRLLFLDADTRLHPEFLARSVAELEDRELAVAGVCMDGTGLPMLMRLGYRLCNICIRTSARFFPTAVGACLFSTPEMHRRTGGFDEALSLCEDCNYVLKAYKENSSAYGVLKESFTFDPRRLQQDGLFSTGLIYVKANLRRFFVGELTRNEIAYPFGHYKQDAPR
ncbi:glycosyltransferase [Roseibium sp.]|uniref:glycosyltransferase n=1 Tax=Roseibium sp. TaxID=1936156 RepID=UPI003BAFABB4